MYSEPRRVDPLGMHLSEFEGRTGGLAILFAAPAKLECYLIVNSRGMLTEGNEEKKGLI